MQSALVLVGTNQPNSRIEFRITHPRVQSFCHQEICFSGFLPDYCVFMVVFVVVGDGGMICVCVCVL